MSCAAVAISDDDILHIDDDIIVVNKPSGLLSVPGREIKDSAVTQLQALFGSIHVVHRLDRDTSGVIVFARHKSALAHIQQQFEQRTTHKIYEALLVGHLKNSNGVINMPIIVDWPNRPKQHINHMDGRYALTRWQIRRYEYLNGCSVTRIDLLPKTGRSHQLRLHTQQLGHPIVGDNLYNNTSMLTNEMRLRLHSRELHLYHPKNNERYCFYNAPSF